MTICSCLVVSFNQESSLVWQILWPQHLKLFNAETIGKVSKYYTFKNERQETLPCCNVQLSFESKLITKLFKCKFIH